MNIVVLNACSNTIVRPDTTLKKNSDDFYVPEFVHSISWSPVLFVRISKPGKYIAPRFAGRHYDSVNYGILLYPEDFIDGREEGYAMASCMDHTSFLPFPMYNKLLLGNPNNKVEFRKNGNSLFSSDFATEENVGRILEEVSKICYLRTGDLACLELQQRQKLCSRDEKTCNINGTCCGNYLMDFKIIF